MGCIIAILDSPRVLDFGGYTSIPVLKHDNKSQARKPSRECATEPSVKIRDNLTPPDVSHRGPSSTLLLPEGRCDVNCEGTEMST